MTTNYISHHGILGQKWGVRRFQNEDGTRTAAGKARSRRDYASTSIRAKLARHNNKKVDKSFESWRENAKKKDTAIALGKKRNASKLDYETDRSNKEKKRAYKADEKAYKDALRKNTTWRKGDIKREVGSDMSRKYLSKANQINKMLNETPDDKTLIKEYGRLMNKHDIERDRARRAPDVARKRSMAIANTKRAITMGVKGAALAGAAYGASAIISNKMNVKIGSDDFARYYKYGKNILGFVSY